MFWTATARHADIVLPSTMTIERDDYGAGQNDRRFFPMPALTRPHGQARDDYTILADVAERLGIGKEFTEGRTALEWLRHLYDQWRAGRRRAIFRVSTSSGRAMGSTFQWPSRGRCSSPISAPIRTVTR